MRALPTFALLLAVPLAAALLPAVPAAAAPLPPLEGRNLAKETLRLPDALGEGPVLVVLPFQRKQQDEAETWLRAAATLGEGGTPLPAWEVVVMEPVGSVLRAVIEGGMRSSVKDATKRARWVNVYSDPAAFRVALGLEPDDQRLRAGLWRAGELTLVGLGACDEAELEALRKAAR